MKSNVALQASLKLSSASQKVWYAANVLRAACTSSPAVLVRAAVAPVVARPAIITQTAKIARTASLPVPAANNTTGFGFGELYLNSPAYPAGTAIPAIPAKPASAVVVGVPAVLPVPAIAAVTSPVVVAIPGQELAVTIDKSVAGIIGITVKFPMAANNAIVGAPETIKEFTPSTLVAPAWIGDKDTSTAPPLAGDLATETLEGYLYRNAKLLPQTVETRVGGNLVVATFIYTDSNFDQTSQSLQFNSVFDNASGGGGSSVG